MTRIAVVGATGRMGRRVVSEVLGAADLSLAAALGREGSAGLGRDVGVLVGTEPCGVALAPLSAGFGDAEVVVDFALPGALPGILAALDGRALVTGTTGLDAETAASLEAAADRAPILWASNFSTGVNLLLALVSQASEALPGFDVEVVEAHHGQKVDAPSGTALALARAAADARGLELEAVREDGRVGRTGPRRPDAIGLHAIRGGSVIGHHEVWLAGRTETIKLVHTASSRDVFARGAVRAARWIAGRAPGRYTMAEVLGLRC